MYDLKKLFEHKIDLYLFNIPIWKTAIDLVNPNIIVVPNLAKVHEPIVDMQQRKINVFMHSSEGMFYSDEVQKEKYPIHLIKKLRKSWLGVKWTLNF